MLRVYGFNWDSGNVQKAKKHGLPIEQIEQFFQSSPYIYPDLKNSKKESRFLAFDKLGVKILFVAFTLRAVDGVLRIRVISARYAHKKEWGKFYGQI
jgi:uncharacterized DUF497 family protein